MKRYFYRFLFWTLLFCLYCTSGTAVQARVRDAVILHTNDIHCGVEDNIGLAALVRYKKQLAEQADVVLVDAGDAIQGTPLGGLSRGGAVLRLLNKAGYAFAVPGNHEFDYGMERFLELAPRLRCGYYSAGFYDLRTGRAVLPAYKIMKLGGRRIALLGVTTPATLTSSAPAYFQDGSGRFLYGFSEDMDGERLYAVIQQNIDAARAAGAEHVILVAHLGLNGVEKRWSSAAVVRHTTGLSAVIDGHSHEQISGLKIRDKSGREVLVAQAGTKLAAVGQLVIHASGEISSSLLTAAELHGSDAAMARAVRREQARYEPLLRQQVGKALVPLWSDDPQTGRRRVRSAETNLGDFVSDALRSVLGAEAALVNGGGIRGNIAAGPVSYNDILQTLPFGNRCVLVEATGQQLLDALEMGARRYPGENGGFLQVSGLSYTVDSSLASAVETDAQGNFLRVKGPYRVSGVRIGGEELQPERRYLVAGTKYLLQDGGDGCSMLQAAELKEDCGLTESDAALEYLQNHLNAEIGSQYAQQYGEGRITIK